MQQRFERRCDEHGSEDRHRAPELDAFSQGGPAVQAPTAVTDHMHGLLVTRADALEGCTEGSRKEAELAALTDAIEACEAVRWPHVEGRLPESASKGVHDVGRK
jgi:hypothetical protein